MEMEQNEFGPKPVLACPLPVFGVTAFATKWGSSASHKSPCRRTARDERVSLQRTEFLIMIVYEYLNIQIAPTVNNIFLI